MRPGPMSNVQRRQPRTVNRSTGNRVQTLEPRTSNLEPGTVNLDRLLAELDAFAAIGGDGHGGVTRLAFTEADRSARRLLQDRLAAAGLAVRVDAIGNVFGRRSGRDNTLSPVLLGSHLDSVPSGGRFDGPLGVLSALEVVRILDDGRTETRRPIEIACFVAEESSRFGSGTLGSKAVVGKLTPEMLEALRDADGRTLAHVLRECGLSPDRLGEVRRRPGEYHAYLDRKSTRLNSSHHSSSYAV